ncbi:restriction endonuclease subunit S [Faecalibacterium prausnitzii]|uniref:Type I restriction modification DNA specificity domain-containing protein n=1 Tax=Faecalibacterium prausnitzii TaxID=853 RepID=A0A3E2TWN2_9FIRM|nr:restriction endonuclease subunit S [Faecalibacterium prausnitzii]RGB84228.1 hypothetical protein DWZ25_10790 [Faecalibacterium prausnitzii]
MTPEQLKASILQYAIQGKLVEQRPEEGTAEELVSMLLQSKAELEQKKLILKKAPTEPFYTAEDLKEWDIPDTWRWVQLSNVSIIQEGAGIRKWQYRDNGTQILCVTNILEGAIDVHKKELYISTEEYEQKYLHLTLNEGDIVTSCSGGSWGKIAFYSIPKTMILNTSTLRMRFFNDLADNNYLYYVCKSQFFKRQLLLQLSGMQPNFGYAHYSKIMIPLPPLAEQKRIVAKIEELLPLVDRYAVAYEKLEQFNAKFPEDMKKSILQYAIQGKLVEQRPEEGTGEELYQQIQAEKQQLIQEKKIKKEKTLPEIAEDEIPFDIPESWKWVRLGDCTGYSQTKTKISPKDITDNMWSLDLEDIQKESGAILTRTIASERKITGDKVLFYKGQVLYSKLRPYLKKILVAPDNGICTPELVPFNTYLVYANYIVYVLRSPHIDYVVNSVTYGVKMPRVGTETMVNLLIPLPPLAEQKRIVAKIEELLPLCERLK